MYSVCVYIYIYISPAAASPFHVIAMYVLFVLLVLPMLVLSLSSPFRRLYVIMWC